MRYFFFLIISLIFILSFFNNINFMLLFNLFYVKFYFYAFYDLKFRFFVYYIKTTLNLIFIKSYLLDYNQLIKKINN